MKAKCINAEKNRLEETLTLNRVYDVEEHDKNTYRLTEFGRYQPLVSKNKFEIVKE